MLVHGSEVTHNQNLQLLSFEGSWILGKAVFMNNVKDKKPIQDTPHWQSSVAMHLSLQKLLM